jgi:ferritin-like metal-binding protein YciE
MSATILNESERVSAWPPSSQIAIAMKNTTQEENTTAMDSDLHELFLDVLADTLNAEQQLTKVLPKMAGAAVYEPLSAAFDSHLAETEYHVTRLEQVFASLNEPVQSKQCNAMKVLLSEAVEMMEEMKGSSALDAVLIAVSQKAEHYEIAAYGTLRGWAEKMGHEEAVELLEATLDEEKAADETLAEIAGSSGGDTAY